MNNATSPSPSSLTIAETWFQSVFIYCFGGLIFCAVANTLILAAVRKYTRLRTRFYVVLTALTIDRLLLSVNFGLMGVYRCLRQAGIVSTEQRRIVCFAIHGWLSIGLQFELTLILLMVIDRTIALIAPIRYTTFTKKSAMVACSVLLFSSMCMRWIPGALWNVLPLEYVACTTIPTSYSVAFGKYGSNIDNALTMSIVLLFFVLIVIVRVRVRRQMNDPTVSEAAKKSLRRQLAVMPILRNQIVLHCGLTWTSRLLILATSYEMFQDYAPRLSYWGGNMLIIDCFANTMAILLGNKDIRKSAADVCRKGVVCCVMKNQVAPHDRT